MLHDPKKTHVLQLTPAATKLINLLKIAFKDKNTKKKEEMKK